MLYIGNGEGIHEDLCQPRCKSQAHLSPESQLQSAYRKMTRLSLLTARSPELALLLCYANWKSPHRVHEPRKIEADTQVDSSARFRITSESQLPIVYYCASDLSIKLRLPLICVFQFGAVIISAGISQTGAMVFFKPERTVSLPTKDILSWIFDDPHFDRDEPVCLDTAPLPLTMLQD